MRYAKNIPIGTLLTMEQIIGKTIEQLSMDHNISQDQVQALINEDKERRSKKLAGPIKKKELRQDLAKEYQEGESTLKIAAKYGITGITAAKYIRECGVEIRDPTEAHRMYHPNEELLDNIDTEEKAYLLGFLWADGYNCESNGVIRLELQKCDKHILLSLAKLFYPYEYIQKVKDYLTTNYFTVNSPKLSKRLAELGCKQGKSLNVKYPKWISEHLEKHFIRGYFDGDGTIGQTEGKYHVGFIGSYDFIKTLKERILKLTQIEFNKITPASSVFCIGICGNIKSYDFSNWMYSGANIYLKRKYKIYKHMHPSGPEEPMLYDSKNVLPGPDGETLTAEYIWNHHDRDSLVKFVFDYYRKNGFPYTKYSDNSLLEQFCALKKYDASIIKNTATTGLNICKHFCSEKFYNSKLNKSKSCIEVFNDDNLFTKTLKNRMGYCTDGSGRPFVYSINNNVVIRGMISSGLSMNVSHFKPTLAKSIIHRYLPEGGSMYDFSAGWGARLLAAESLGVKYTGIDPNTHKELNNMIGFFKFNSIVTNNISEEFIPEENVDLCFSCPPYFNQELYSNNEDQSYNKYSSLDEWIDEYWGRTVENCYKSLNKGGIFSYVIPAKLKDKMDEKCSMFKHIEDIGIENQHGHLSRRSGKKVNEFLVSWKK